MKEWRDIPNWEGLYQVSNDGSVRSLSRHRHKGRVLTPSVAGFGYRKVALTGAGRFEHRYVHELVLTVFVGPRPEGQHAAHFDGVRDNNRLDNLRWATPVENAADKSRHGTAPAGENHGRRKLSAQQVEEIRSAEGSCAAIGRRFGVGPMQISRIKTGKNWRLTT